jgi:hypothetical protein
MYSDRAAFKRNFAKFDFTQQGRLIERLGLFYVTRVTGLAHIIQAREP